MVLLLGLVAAGSAQASEGWWQLTASARPTVLNGGSAQDETQEVTVKASGGSLILKTTEESEVFEFFAFNATAAEVQAGLEHIYGAGNIHVTGGRDEVTGVAHYTVEFVGALADQSVPKMFAIGVLLEGEETEAAVEERSVGKADGEIVVTAENLGDESIDGSRKPVHISDVVPPGLTAVGISATAPSPGGAIDESTQLPCSLETVTCTLTGTLVPYDQIEMRIAVAVGGSAATGEVNGVKADGGGVPEGAAEEGLSIGGPTPFGVDYYLVTPEEEGGRAANQAGSHPFQLTTTIGLNQTADTTGLQQRPNAGPAGGLPRNVDLEWPAGMIGDPSAVRQCGLGQFLTRIDGATANQCSADSAVGVATTVVNEPGSFEGVIHVTEPVFELEPAEGEPARFGFFVTVADVPVVIDTAVRSGGDYGVTIKADGISQTTGLILSAVTIWGTPGDSRHNGARGWGCLAEARGEEKHLSCGPSEESQPKPFLSLPTSCTGLPLASSVSALPWNSQTPVSASTLLPALSGCGEIPFSPTIEAIPDSSASSSPTGMHIDVHIPQEASKAANGEVESDVKDIALAFPEGMTLNPSAAEGLQACAESEVGYLAAAGDPPEQLQFTPSITPPFCSEASKIGTVRIKTPLLPNALEGAVYLAKQEANPFGTLVAAYLVVRDPVSGTLVKLAGEITLDQTTGQITSHFRGNPQLPFEDAEIDLFGGAHAAFVTPAHCGQYTTTASLSPWSGTEPVEARASFTISSGPGGTPCPSALPSAPTMTAGATTPIAGSFSPLLTSISRPDGDQMIRSVSVRTPAGISGVLTGVELCKEADANAGTCGPRSLIGSSSVSVGAGSEPFAISGGRVYLTESYNGAPFGLSIVTPAKAGPFDLGLVVVRARLEVDPHTAELIVSTDESGPHAIPTILDGIPLYLRRISVAIDRAHFTFNPTSCKQKTITGSLLASEGASSPLSSPFAVADCARLGFKPHLAATVNGRATRAGGTSLKVKLTFPKGAFGAESNIAKVKVTLPKKLPSRQRTLQHACLERVFEVDPSRCPRESRVGQAAVRTPVLPVPLTGPAYFVSHGGEAFPSLVLVLKGYGLTIDVVGQTLIRHGVTSTTFATVPDVPFESFELNLPKGLFSALGAFGRLCGSKLVMPTEYVAQTGTSLDVKTKIAVTNCPRKKHPRSGKQSK